MKIFFTFWKHKHQFKKLRVLFDLFWLNFGSKIIIYDRYYFGYKIWYSTLSNLPNTLFLSTSLGMAMKVPLAVASGL